MAILDVSELMNDPDLCSLFTVTRMQQTVVKGRTRVTPNTPMTVVGVVVPASGRTMDIMPNMTSVHGVIEIWTKFRLEGPSDTTQADVITWQGRDYIINVVQPYTNFGAGFIHAVATMLQFVAASPTAVISDREDDDEFVQGL